MDESRQRSQAKTLWGVGSIALISIVVVAVFASSGPLPADDPVPSGATVEVPDPNDVYDPVRAGEPLPQGYRQLLSRDQITPVYNPIFVDIGDVDWSDDTLVIGVAGDDAAKAYPVTFLNSREMVVDDIEGIPILVSW